MNTDEENMEELLQEFGSPEAIEISSREKESTEDVFEDVGVQVKDYPSPQCEIDLHGHTGSEAMFELSNFLNRSIDQRVQTVRVITGKGMHSKHLKSVLPEKTEQKLAEFRRADKVLTFRREKTGGSYVVYLIS